MKIIKRIINWLFNFGELKLDSSPKSSPKSTTIIADENLDYYNLACLSSNNKCPGILGGKGPDGPIGISGIAKGLKCI